MVDRPINQVFSRRLLFKGSAALAAGAVLGLGMDTPAVASSALNSIERSLERARRDELILGTRNIRSEPVWGGERRGHRAKWKTEELPVVIDRVRVEAPIIGLTIDDGWLRRQEILKTLVDQKAGATLFILGQVAQRDPDFIKVADAVGNVTGNIELGNHTFDHKPLTYLTGDDIQAELDRSESIYDGILGRSNVTVPYLRPPYGSQNAFTRDIAAACGYRSILWNIGGDYLRRFSPQEMYDFYMKQIDSVRDPRGLIILIHFTPQVDYALPYLIAGIRDRGLEPVSLSTIFANQVS